MKNYNYLGKSDGRKFCIEGVDVFSHKWKTLGECDIVLEPKTNKPFSFSMYEIEADNRTVKFLAGKFDDEYWSFFIGKKEEEDYFF